MDHPTVRLLAQCNRLARKHHGMAIDLERFVGNAGYRNELLDALALTRSEELGQLVVALREKFGAPAATAASAAKRLTWLADKPARAAA